MRTAHRVLTAAGMAAIATASAGAATDQNGPDAQGDHNDIIVTAQKRSERLQDVPISITAVSADELQKRRVLDPNDLPRISPGFTYKTTALNVPVYSIRGIGFDDISIDASPAVSVSVDQVPLPFLSLTPAASLDIERVEVLKGPQGTLFGQNTTGGAVNYIAAKPTADPQAGFDLSYGRFNEVRGSAYLSAPVTGSLRARLAVRHDARDGWQVSETRPRDRLGKRNFTAARLLADWTPSDALSVELNANAWFDRSETPAAQYQLFAYSTPPSAGGSTNTFNAIGNRLPAATDPRAADWTPGHDYRHDDRQYQLSARVDLKPTDDVTVTSITSYVDYKTRAFYDVDGSNYNSFDANQYGTIKTFYQEVRAFGDFKGVKVIVGGNLQHDDTYQDRYSFSNASNSVIAGVKYSGFHVPVRQKVDTVAAFGNLEVSLLPTLTAQAGIRYTSQEKDFAGCLADNGDGTLAAGVARISTARGGATTPAAAGGCVTLNPRYNPARVFSKLDEHNLSWRAGLSWKPQADALIYGNIARGYKGGGFTPQAAVFSSGFAPAKQEKVTAYEAGAKALLLDRAVDVAVAFYYDDYVNKQLLGFRTVDPFGALISLLNVPKSTVKGVEASLTLRPVKGLSLGGGVNFVKTKVTESFVTNNPITGGRVDILGEAFPNAPKWQATGNAEYEFAVTDGLKASFGGDVSYRSSASAAFGKAPVFHYDSYALLGLRAGVASLDDRWRVQLFGQNVTNKYYWVNVFKSGDVVTRIAGMPATYGVALSMRF